MKHQTFVYTLLNDLRVLFQTIQFRISHLFVLNLNKKQFYLTHTLDPIWYYHSGQSGHWKEYSAFPKAPKLLEPDHQIA